MRHRRFARRGRCCLLFLALVVCLSLGPRREARTSEDWIEGIFASAQDFRLLGTLLGDRDLSGRVSDLVACMPLWKIAIRPTSGAKFPDYRISFGFDMADRRSDRGAFVAFNMRRGSRGAYELESIEESYGPISRQRIRPTCSDPLCVDILRASARNEEFISQVAEWFEPELATMQLTIERIGEVLGDEGPPSFRIGLHRIGFAGASKANSKYWHVYYDTVTDTVEILSEEEL